MKRYYPRNHFCVNRDHLDATACQRGWMGLSQHSRGALYYLSALSSVTRIIPARAGSTWLQDRRALQSSDHPRSCGEHLDEKQLLDYGKGSSPLVRRARLVAVSFEVPFGIIPARAGSTPTGFPTGFSVGDHPRSCGEHTPLYFSLRSIWGSSPLVRGARRRCRIRQDERRIIPARAGSTPRW